eukprot:scaffold3.g6240.t1
MGREVLTLQFGSYANYVGAHYWNFQDEVLGLQETEAGGAAAGQLDSGVLYRQGETPSGQPTYTPRLVLFDLSGSLGGASGAGSLYQEPPGPPVVATWRGRHEVHRAPPVAKSAFAAALEEEEEGEEGAAEERGAARGQGGGGEAADALAAAAAALDAVPGGGGPQGGGVRYFSDYLKAHIHPRSIYQLQGVWAGTEAYDGWGDGAAYASSAERREEMLERARFFAEEADSLQGVQCFVDDLSGFGRLAAELLPELREDLGPRLPVALFAVRPSMAEPAGLTPATARRRRIGEGLSAAWLSAHCDAYAVVAPPAEAAALPLLSWQAEQPYHTSALCAAALDTATLPYRLTGGGGGSGEGIGRMDMWSLAQLLTSQHGTPLAALSMAMPCPPLPADAQQAAQQADARFERHGGGGTLHRQPFTQRHTASLTPSIPSGPDALKYAESVVLRGPRSEAHAPVALGAAAAALDADLLQERERCVRQCTLCAQALPVPLPYPHLFGALLSPAGDMLPAAEAPTGGRHVDVASCPVLTRLAGTAAFAPALRGVAQRLQSASASAQGQSILEGWGYAREEQGEAQERLRVLAHVYEDESSGSLRIHRIGDLAIRRAACRAQGAHKLQFALATEVLRPHSPQASSGQNRNLEALTRREVELARAELEAQGCQRDAAAARREAEALARQLAQTKLDKAEAEAAASAYRQRLHTAEATLAALREEQARQLEERKRAGEEAARLSGRLEGVTAALQREAEVREAATAESQQQLCALAADLAAAEAENARLHAACGAQLAEAAAVAANAAAQHEQDLAQAQHLQRELEAAQAKRDEEVASLHAQLQRRHDDACRLQEQLDAEEREREELCSGLRSELARSEASSATACQARQQAQAAAALQATQLERQFDELRAHNAELQRHNDALRAAAHAGRAHQQRVSDLQAALEARSAELGAAEAQRQELQEELERRAARESELQRALAAAEQERSKLAARCQGLGAQIDGLRLAAMSGPPRGPSYLAKPSAVVASHGCRITAASSGLIAHQQRRLAEGAPGDRAQPLPRAVAGNAASPRALFGSDANPGSSPTARSPTKLRAEGLGAPVTAHVSVAQEGGDGRHASPTRVRISATLPLPPA